MSGTGRDTMAPALSRRAARPAVPGSAEWLRLARLARLARILSWATLAWMGIEGGVAIGAALAAGSVALLGFGLDSGIEAIASVIEGRRAWAGESCGCACQPGTPCATESAVIAEDLPHLPGGVADQHVPGRGVGPPSAQRGVQDQAG
jgi:hypothetical protein